MAGVNLEARLVMSLCREATPAGDLAAGIWEAQAEVAADFRDTHRVEFRVTVAPPPAPAPPTGTFFFMRHEPKR